MKQFQFSTVLDRSAKQQKGSARCGRLAVMRMLCAILPQQTHRIYAAYIDFEYSVKASLPCQDLAMNHCREVCTYFINQQFGMVKALHSCKGSIP